MKLVRFALVFISGVAFGLTLGWKRSECSTKPCEAALINMRAIEKMKQNWALEGQTVAGQNHKTSADLSITNLAPESD